MKIEQLIVQHLYNSKKVSLQDIGTFFLSSEIAMPVESDKEMIMPDNAVKFEFNKRAPQDDDLISFIVAQTRKIKPLATSDLESYSILARQFLNIGKPFPIEGLGVLVKNQAGTYEFLQGHSVNARLDAAPALLREKTEEEISFSTVNKVTDNSKAWMVVVLISLIIVAAALYYFLNKDTNKNNLEPVAFTADSVVTVKDTFASVQDTSLHKVAEGNSIATNDGFTFKIVIKEYQGKRSADVAFAKLTSYGHKLLLYPKDSFVYKIAMPFTSPLSDTIKAKDSLRVFFGGQPYVEKN
ncbi:MAG: hypothetical protein ABIO04_11630 [Ferruginibacter sp.]